MKKYFLLLLSPCASAHSQHQNIEMGIVTNALSFVIMTTTGVLKINYPILTPITSIMILQGYKKISPIYLYLEKQGG